MLQSQSKEKLAAFLEKCRHFVEVGDLDRAEVSFRIPDLDPQVRIYVISANVVCVTVSDRNLFGYIRRTFDLLFYTRSRDIYECYMTLETFTSFVAWNSRPFRSVGEISTFTYPLWL